jgi:hypothetical protein
LKKFSNNLSEDSHKIKILANQLVRECEIAKIPIFLSYYVPGKGYQYNALLPEEIGEDMKGEYNKFKRFLQVCVDFNKEDYFPKIQ